MSNNDKLNESLNGYLNIDSNDYKDTYEKYEKLPTEGVQYIDEKSVENAKESLANALLQIMREASMHDMVPAEELLEHGYTEEILYSMFVNYKEYSAFDFYTCINILNNNLDLEENNNKTI